MCAATYASSTLMQCWNDREDTRKYVVVSRKLVDRGSIKAVEFGHWLL